MEISSFGKELSYIASAPKNVHNCHIHDLLFSDVFTFK